MVTIRKALYVSTLSVLALGMTGCESMKAARDKVASIDFPSFGGKDEIATDEDGILMASNEGCPQIAVVDDLKTLTQFETPATPTPGTKISSIAITGMESDCSLTDKTVAVNIGLRFDGQLGPQAADWTTESRSFAYPYFVAVTTPAGEILSKEVFAATIRYEKGEMAITQQESMRQVIPLPEKNSASGYEILIGFQLTEDELTYARMMAPTAAATEPAAGETEYDLSPEAKATPVQPEVSAAPPTPVAATPIAAPVVAEPAKAPVPTTTDGSVTAAPTSAEIKQETPHPVAETVTPAEPAAAPRPPEDAEAAAAAPAQEPTANPYAPAQTQVIRIKADGSVETQKN